jgi:hypothetical protein
MSVTIDETNNNITVSKDSNAVAVTQSGGQVSGWILEQTGSVCYSPIMQWKFLALDMLAQLVQLDPKAQAELAMALWMT